jgi:hypothetical protein
LYVSSNFAHTKFSLPAERDVTYNLYTSSVFCYANSLYHRYSSLYHNCYPFTLSASYYEKMHTLTLSSLALALGTLTINAEKTSTAGNPNFKSEKPLPVYNWEHRTICMQDILNPQRKDKEEYLKYDVQIVGYAWDETNGLTPDHKWNWNTTKNARVKIWQNIPMAGDISDFKFMSGERDNRGFTQFTVEVSCCHFPRGAGSREANHHPPPSIPHSQTLPGRLSRR